MSQIKVAFSSSFRRSLKSFLNKNPSKRIIFEEKPKLFIENPYHPRLETYKLKERLKGYLAFTIEYDLKGVFNFENEKQSSFYKHRHPR